MISLVFVLCFVLHSQVCGQIVQFGSCPKVATVPLFDIERFLGTWHEIERFPVWFEERGACAYKRIQTCGRLIQFQHVFVKDDIKYVLHVNSSYNPGDEAVFRVQPNSIDPVGIPLSVVATDYRTYAVLYGCEVNAVMGIKYTLAWILSRETTLPPETLTQARKTLATVPYSSTLYLEPVTQDQSLCTHHWTASIHAVNTSDLED